jgi:hypothetical protein
MFLWPSNLQMLQVNLKKKVLEEVSSNSSNAGGYPEMAGKFQCLSNILPPF